MRAKLAILTACVISSCDVSSSGGDGTKMGSDASEFVQRVFQADLPPSHTDAQTLTRSLMTTVVQGRFEIPESDFQDFLKSSALLPDLPEAGNPLAGTSDSIPWWKPGSLGGPTSVSCDWMDGDSVATCDLVGGFEADDYTVYFMVIYEHRDSTGARPTAQVDPSWQPGKNTLQQGVTPQSATRAESKLEGSDNPQPESEARSR